MLRAVLAVAIAAALLAVSLPAVDSGRVDHAETLVVDELDRVEAAAERLVAENDATGPGQPSARRVLTLRLPAESWGSAGVDRLHIPEGSSTVTWQVSESGTHHRRLADGLVVGQTGGLRLGSSGLQRVALVLRERGGELVVVATRPDTYDG